MVRMSHFNPMIQAEETDDIMSVRLCGEFIYEHYTEHLVAT